MDDQAHSRLAYVAAVLAWLNPATRRLRRWPGLTQAERDGVTNHGWDGETTLDRTEKHSQSAATGNILIEAAGNRIT